MKKPTPFGKYYLLERINVGGMAEVFRAKAFGVEGFERLVAVKRILPNIAEDKEFIRMFIEEAKLAVQLNHANIAQIFDLGVVDGAYYIALEHIHGRDLRGMFDRCRQLGEPMPVSQACFVVMKVCEGLDYAHNKRDQSGRELHLVHRDVSPQNVLVSFEGEVKLIDFGIAKAASKGPKTQAGILKGKFGYMSPEQVRGIPIDRRSDVFSCGIVLYELLTGERLFVGESDFSTLEKVRNVEILPPSTYNRRIPDELERIVLKALAKDPEERYQNAIDLHDELQAFVYTAGEFYSRKDLAGWMKKIFGREIEEETAKLESYRQLKAPAEVAQPAPVVARTSTGNKPPAAPRRPPPQGTKPPPVPSQSGRISQQVPTVPTPRITAATDKVAREGSDQLAWDDDELETQIYDNADDDPKLRQRKSGPNPVIASEPAPVAPAPVAPAPIAPAPVAAAPVAPLPATGPDLSSLVPSAKAWGNAPAPLPPPPNGRTTGPSTALGVGAPANGSSTRPGPSAPPPVAPVAPEISVSARLVAQPLAAPALAAPDLFDPVPTFGQGMLARKDQTKDRKALYLAVGGAAVAVLAVVIIIAMTGGKKSKPSPGDKADKGSAVATSKPAAPVAVADQNTGFDLYVRPGGVAMWRLDGEPHTESLPRRIRGITPGPHTVAIDAPPGFMSQNQPITVEAGKAPRIDIQLQAIQGINGSFESTPPGATVSLIIDGKAEKLGASPAKAPLDPRKTYQVLFEKPGYISVNRPIVFTGSLDEKIAVNLEKISGAAPSTTPSNPTAEKPATSAVTTAQKPATTAQKPNTGASKPAGGAVATAKPDTGAQKPTTTKAEKAEKPEKPDTTAVKPPSGGSKPDSGTTAVAPDPGPSTPEPPKPSGQGTLLIGSKPPCDIFVDGSSTGLHTPQKDLKLSAGHHKITLVNNEYGIKETFTVEIKPDQVEKQIKDYSDRIPK